ncbi:MAG: acetylxylan esterase [Candidatus Hydrogenedentes bacterium]|nr:acetylxylan esterase [Candidatus Hydrogenedentota bacterium]
MRRLPTIATLTALVAGITAAQPKDFNAYPEHITPYLQRMFSDGQGKFAWRDNYPGGVDAWRNETRAALSDRIGLGAIAAQAGAFEPRVILSPPDDMGGYTRQQGAIETEPSVTVAFWLLKPKGDGPYPLALLPHGHDTAGHDTHIGLARSDGHRKKIEEEDRDVAVQAVERGFLAIAPATRGMAAGGVPDLHDRHGKRDCRAQQMHCLLAGRTAMGERVWDMMRLIDWAAARDDVDASRILVMGNSGGGMVTIYTAALDTRVTVAVPSCSFCALASPSGYIYHCDCNLVPGLLDFGDLADIAGLTSPRAMLAVNGREDPLFDPKDVERAAGRTKAIYTAAGAPDRFDHQWGHAGHRFYSDLMWPFVMAHIGE